MKYYNNIAGIVTSVAPIMVLLNLLIIVSIIGDFVFLKWTGVVLGMLVAVVLYVPKQFDRTFIENRKNDSSADVDLFKELFFPPKSALKDRLILGYTYTGMWILFLVLEHLIIFLHLIY